MAIGFEVEGFKELERALAGMNVNTAKGVARRTMKKSLSRLLQWRMRFGPDQATMFLSSQAALQNASHSLKRAVQL